MSRRKRILATLGLAAVLTGTVAVEAACTPTMVNCKPGTVHCWN